MIEDDFLIAEILKMGLASLGAEVLGPAPSVLKALDAIATERLDGALVDVNLRGEMSYRVMDELQIRAIPFVLLTGYSPRILEPHYLDHPRLQKPFGQEDLEAVCNRYFGRKAAR